MPKKFSRTNQERADVIAHYLVNQIFLANQISKPTQRNTKIFEWPILTKPVLLMPNECSQHQMCEKSERGSRVGEAINIITPKNLVQIYFSYINIKIYKI